MSSSPFKTPAQIMRHSSLSTLLDKSKINQFVEKLLKERVDRQFVDLFRVSQIREQRLIIAVPNATAKQGFARHTDVFLNIITPHLPHINQIEFYIEPQFNTLR